MPADRDPFLDDLARELRKETLSPSADARIMEAVHRTGVARWPRLLMPRRMFVTPLPWSLAAAAVVLFAVFLGATIAPGRSAVTESQRLVDGKLQHQFVLVSPSARKVSVVGDFNAWDASHAQFQAHHTGGGVWTVTAPVSAGHHRYSFVVDDTMWVADPNAPSASDPDYGVPKSVLVIGSNNQ